MVGRTVLITGAGRGIGAGAAERLWARGANVVLVDLDTGPVAALAGRLGERALAVAADVRDGDAMARAVRDAVDRFGGLDVVIANAGVAQVGALAAAPPEAIERTIDVNLLGVWRTDRAALAELIRSRGYLLNVASLAAATHTAANGAYAASKAGVEAMTDALRVELAGAGVAVGCAYFGYIDTELERESVEHPAIRSLQAMMPGWARRAAPVSVAVDAIEGAVRRRRARVWAPRYVGPLLLARGLLQPLAERRAMRDRVLLADLADTTREGLGLHA